MARLIDANDLLQKAQWFEDYCDECGSEIAFKYIDPEDVENAQTVDAVEVVHGRWKRTSKYDYEAPVQCSNCLMVFDYIDGICHLVADARLPHYCPNCGAKMDGNPNNTQTNPSLPCLVSDHGRCRR